MTPPITAEAVYAAGEQLARSPRGIKAAAGLLDWLDAGASGLDSLNRAAIQTMLDAAWGPRPSDAYNVLLSLKAVGRPRHEIVAR